MQVKYLLLMPGIEQPLTMVAVIVSITLNRDVLSFREGNVSKVTSSKNGMQTQVYWTLVLSLDCTRFVVSVKILFIQKCHICLPHQTSVRSEC